MLSQDLLFALRQWRRRPGFTIAIVAALALGLGASMAVFSAVDRILFRSLPYPRAEELVSVGTAAPIEPAEFVLGTDYIDWPRRDLPFRSFTTLTPGSDCDLTEANPQRLRCAQVEASFLRTFEIMVALGRDFREEDDRPGAPRVALLSHAFWRTRFAGSPDALERSLNLDGQTVRIVGVLPPDCEMPNLAEADLLLPQQLDVARQRASGSGRLMRGFARLKPAVSIEQARQQMQPLLAEALTRVPAAFRKEVTMRVRWLRDRQVGDAREAA